MTIEAAGYTRLSRDGLSIPKQKDQIQSYCDSHGFVLVEIHDDGERASGYDTDDRPNYRKLRQLVVNGDIDAVVVRDTDRIGRDFDERMRFVLDCREGGIELHSVEYGQHDLSDPFSVVIETAQAAGADVQKRHEIERSKDATKQRIADGCYHGRVPFGLRFAEDNCHLEKDPDEYSILKEIIDRRDQGETVASIGDRVGLSAATISRMANRGLEWYREKLEEYGEGEP